MILTVLLLFAVVCISAKECTSPRHAVPNLSLSLLQHAARAVVDARGHTVKKALFTSNELRVFLEHGFSVGLSTRGGTAFRIRLDAGQQPIDTPMVAPEKENAPWTQVSSSVGHGIAVADVGSLIVSADGVITLMNSEGHVLTSSSPVAHPNEIRFTSINGLVYGRGAGADDASQLTLLGNVTPVVNNQYGKGSQSHVPHYYAADGYAALGVSDASFTTAEGSFLSATYAASADRITWRNTREGPFELYLMPAPTLELGTAAYYNLIGTPRVPPLWTFGFMASRWGWENYKYVNDTLSQFRSGGFPADAFITDFEWYTNESDYSFMSQGKSYCNDFAARTELLPNGNETLAYFKSNLHFRFGGIRKARLCNTELLEFARSQGFILPQGCPGGDPTVPGWTPAVGTYGVGRELNFSDPRVQSWYSQHQAHFLKDGVSFWWNDEGETSYFTFLWWCITQARTLHEKDPTKRYYSLNRNFAPGMARLGAAVWTGDSAPEWWVLAAQPGFMLNWALAGLPYVGSDIGGFTADTSPKLLTRWYQLGVFMPVMRVHSTKDATPHWPWLFGEEASDAMKSALELRYRLIPYHYSWAHAMFLNRRLWMRPMGVAFPDDAEMARITSQWMDGELLVAPVLSENSEKLVHLPSGSWFPLEGGAPVVGPTVMRGAARLDEIPVFAPAGSIVVLAPLVQYTDALPGGPLEVRIFRGKDATFELFEDDGESLAYLSGGLRSTVFRWNESRSELSWVAQGSTATQYKSIYVTSYGTSGVGSPPNHVDITPAGTVQIKEVVLEPESGSLPPREDADVD
eukprot:TRINITY_DN35084_c0_g1_i1.p1 TRINITY_DN35084_c0_g1~~TRINITY_DN35084_c0_g1_i1.p1  ORF type:complete len:803 (+),score=70.30 TRINITY_DN35084_c0_g1_i1:184-2592(+)